MKMHPIQNLNAGKLSTRVMYNCTGKLLNTDSFSGRSLHNTCGTIGVLSNGVLAYCQRREGVTGIDFRVERRYFA